MVSLALAWTLVLTAGLYVAGAYLTGARRQRWPLRRTVAFLAGLAAIGLAAFSPLDIYARELFSAHMVQHMLIITVGAPLILLGAPVLPVVRGTPPRLRGVLRPLLGSAVVRSTVALLRNPLVATALYVVGLYGWHSPRSTTSPSPATPCTRPSTAGTS